MDAPTLTTDRLIIAPLTLEHLGAYCATWSDPQVLAGIGGGAPRTRQENWGKYLQGAGMWPVLGYGYWAFLDRETKRFIGNGGLAQFDRGIALLEGYPEAGWAFVPDAWGRGLATEGMKVILAWADTALGRPEIRCIIGPENTTSQRVAAKLGFAAIGAEQDKLGRVAVFARPAVG